MPGGVSNSVRGDEVDAQTGLPKSKGMFNLLKDMRTFRPRLELAGRAFYKEQNTIVYPCWYLRLCNYGVNYGLDLCTKHHVINQ